MHKKNILIPDGILWIQSTHLNWDIKTVVVGAKNSNPNPTNYHVIENIVHISKGDKFSILVLAITIDTDNPVNFYIFDIKVKIVYMNGNETEEIRTRDITNWNNIKKIVYTADDDLSPVQIDIKETILTSWHYDHMLYRGMEYQFDKIIIYINPISFNHVCKDLTDDQTNQLKNL